MEIRKIEKYIEVLDTHFRVKFKNSSEYERMLTRAVKLNEEVGELCEAVLHEGKEQREDKGGIDFGGEIADVIISTLMLARVKDVDVWGEVEKKLEKIKDWNDIPLA